MPLPIVFARLPAGDNPASLLDYQFAALAGFVFIPCAAVGQNVIELTQFADAPLVNSYTDLAPVFTFVASETCSGNVELNVNQLGEFPAYKNNGSALIDNGDIVAGSVYQAAFVASLNGGAGGFVVNVPAPLNTGVQPGGPDVANVIMTTFTTSGVWTPGANLIAAIIEGVGAGGAGGNVATSVSYALGGGGGGAGGYFRIFMTAAQIGSAMAITVGVGGASGSDATGGNTSASVYAVADGGGGGQGNDGTTIYGVPGAGGATAIGGGIIGLGIRGNPGTWGGTNIGGATPFLAFGGAGGQGAFGGGGEVNEVGPGGVQNGFPGQGGGGGSGAVSNNAASGAANGGAGGNGWVIVTAYYAAA